MGTLAICVALFLLVSVKCEVGDQSSNPIGVNYGTRGNNIPPPSQVVQLLKNTNIGKVKLYDANPDVLRAFAGSLFHVTVGIPNELISTVADANAAMTWVNQNVVAYLPETRIRGISVGNEALTSRNQQLASLVVPAMQSLYTALITLKLEKLVKITAPQSLAILGTSFPPSAGAFRPQLAQSAIIPMLKFLRDTDSAFMVNAYPFMAYRSNPQDVSLAYCLFLPNAGVTDPGTGIVYSNMFGAMLDAVISAMNKLQFPTVKIGVSETGWPSLGDPDEIGVTLQNAMQYNKNLIFYISSNPGTPLRPKQQIDTYLFSLYNENLKEGPASERNYGLFRPDGSTVYDIGILKSGSVITPPSPVTNPTPPSPGTSPTTPSPGTTPTTPSPGTTPTPPSPGTTPNPTPPSPGTTPTPPSPGTTPTPPSPGISPTPRTPTTPPSAQIPPPPLTIPLPPSSRPPAPPYTAPSPPSVVNPPPMILHPPPILPPSPVRPPPVTPSPVNPSPENPSPSGGHGAPIWCVAKPNADVNALAGALNYACGEGEADCTAIQPGGACYYPNDLNSHASYAFNSYYQIHGRNYWNCDFMSNAVVAISDPSYGGCTYPAK